MVESSPSKRLVGGISRVVIYPASTPLPEEFGDREMGYEFLPEYGESSYSESVVRIEESTSEYYVDHLLTLTIDQRDYPSAPKHLTKILAQGVIADITLASGAQLRVGVSERFGLEAPLRLVSTLFSSGTEATDYPLTKWVWSSRDCEVLI